MIGLLANLIILFKFHNINSWDNLLLKSIAFSCFASDELNLSCNGTLAKKYKYNMENGDPVL
jgi:hypothetical protein